MIAGFYRRGELMINGVLFQTPGQHYLYDRYTNNIFKISGRLYNSIENEKEITEIDEYTKLKENGLFSDFKIDQIQHPETRLLKYKLERKLETMTLQITQQCNLRCSYCVYSGNYRNRMHTNEIMSDEIAKKGLDFLAEHSIDSDRVHISFYGGEPLLRFEFVRKQMEYAKNRLKGKEITFGMTTNATLLTEEIIDYFASNEVMLRISIDGDKEGHDKNRKFANSNRGSFGAIIKKIEMIANMYPEYFKKLSFNIVLDPQSPFKNIALFFKNTLFSANNNLTAGLISDKYALHETNISEIFKQEYGYELFKYLLFKLGILEEKEVSNLFEGYFNSIDIIEKRVLSELGSVMHPGGPCLPGVRKLFVTTDGTFYPCERVDEESDIMKIGSVYDGFYIEKALSILNIGLITNQDCKNCWAVRYCKICAAMADDSTGFSREKKLKVCETVKQNTLVSLKNYCLLKELGYHS